jgi:iron-sulfur cluster repair protein YtfE (RIC family)
MNRLFDLRLPELLLFIRETCHERLKDELVELRALNALFMQSLYRHEIPIEFPMLLDLLMEKIENHLWIEEVKFFPLIEEGKKEMGLFPIYSLLDDHDDLRNYLIRLKEMTGHFYVSSKGRTLKRYMDHIKELDRLIMNHATLQEKILYPMVMRASQELR